MPLIDWSCPLFLSSKNQKGLRGPAYLYLSQNGQISRRDLKDIFNLKESETTSYSLDGRELYYDPIVLTLRKNSRIYPITGGPYISYKKPCIRNFRCTYSPSLKEIRSYKNILEDMDYTKIQVDEKKELEDIVESISDKKHFVEIVKGMLHGRTTIDEKIATPKFIRVFSAVKEYIRENNL